MSTEPNEPSLAGQRLGQTLARVCNAALKVLREDYATYPGPCANCVFTEGSTANQCMPQVRDAMKAVLEDSPMVCPCKRLDEGGVPEPCVGWMASKAARAGEEPKPCPWPYSFDRPGHEGHIHLGVDGGDYPLLHKAVILPFRKTDPPSERVVRFDVMTQSIIAVSSGGLRRDE